MNSISWHGPLHGKSSGMTAYLKEYHPLMAIEGHCPSVKDSIWRSYCILESIPIIANRISGMIQRFTNGMFVEVRKIVDLEVVEYQADMMLILCGRL